MRKFVVIFLFLACSLSNNFVESKKEIVKLPNYIEFPLIWQKSPRVKLWEMGVHPNVVQSLEKTYKSGIGMKKEPIRNDTVQIFKYLDNEFFAQVSLGHPGRSFLMILDTEWADSFVPSIHCSDSNIACKSKNKYDHSASSQYVDPNKVYNENGLTGNLAMDLLHLGHVNVTNFTFAELNYVPNSFLFNKADGILGLGFKELNTYNGLPFFYRLTQLNPQMPRIFSFYFNREPTSKKGGTLALGMIQEKHFYTPLNYFKVTSNVYWQIKMDKAIIEERKTKNDTLCAKGCTAMIDTGSTNIGVPADDLAVINKVISATEVSKSGRYAVDCRFVNKLPHFHFVFNGIEHSLKGKEIVQEIDIDSKHYCVTVFTLAPAALSNTWKLGTRFLYRHYSVFDLDKRQIGLAKGKI